MRFYDQFFSVIQRARALYNIYRMKSDIQKKVDDGFVHLCNQQANPSTLPTYFFDGMNRHTRSSKANPAEKASGILHAVLSTPVRLYRSIQTVCLSVFASIYTCYTWCCSHDWHCHWIQTFEARFSRGTQRFLSLVEIAFSFASVNWAHQFFVSSFFYRLAVNIVFLFLSLGCVEITVLGVSFIFTVPEMVLYNFAGLLVRGLAFALALLGSNIAFVAVARWLYPLGTGKGRARLDGSYRDELMPYLLRNNPVLFSEGRIQSHAEAFGLQNGQVKDFCTALKRLFGLDPAAYRGWLLDNMMDAIRGFKNVLKRLQLVYTDDQSLVAELLSVQNRLTKIVAHMKNRQGHHLDNPDIDDCDVPVEHQSMDQDCVSHVSQKIDDCYQSVQLLMKKDCFSHFSQVSKLALWMAFKMLIAQEKVSPRQLENERSDDGCECVAIVLSRNDVLSITSGISRHGFKSGVSDVEPLGSNAVVGGNWARRRGKKFRMHSNEKGFDLSRCHQCGEY